MIYMIQLYYKINISKTREERVFAKDHKVPTKRPKGRACWRQVWPRACLCHSNATNSPDPDANPCTNLYSCHLQGHVGSICDRLALCFLQTLTETEARNPTRRSSFSFAAPSIQRSSSCSLLFAISPNQSPLLLC